MLILVRHGRTAANALGLLQGRADHPLDEVGLRQIECVAEVLAGEPVARVVSSPLRRAADTAAAVARRHGLEVILDERFTELDYGDFDGLAMGSLDADIWRTWRADPQFRPPGGESLAELDERVRPALAELLAHTSRSPDGAVTGAMTGAVPGATVVVSHVSPIKSAMVWALGGTTAMTWRLVLDRASISRVVAGPHGPAVSAFNDTSHLPADLAR